MRRSPSAAIRANGVRALDYAAVLLARAGKPVQARGRRRTKAPRYDSGVKLVDAHFQRRSEPGLIDQTLMREAVQQLQEQPSVILETGSSAWGTDSSRLFDEYVSCYGGEFATVDLRIAPLLRLRGELGARSTLVCDDSVRFLRSWVAENPGRRVDLVYLDSFDLDLASPTAAAIHGLLEFEAIRPALGEGSLLLVDDTPASTEFLAEEDRPVAMSFFGNTGLMPGKGMLIDVYLRNDPSVVKLDHRYQALYRFGGGHG